MKPLFQKFNVSLSLFSILIGLLIIIPRVYGEAYTSDDLGRLTTVRFDDGAIIRYEYDPAGNITSRIVTDATKPVDHALEPDHSSFEVIEEGKRHEIILKKG